MIDLALRVQDLGHCWLRHASSREEVEYLILLEQYFYLHYQRTSRPGYGNKNPVP